MLRSFNFIKTNSHVLELCGIWSLCLTLFLLACPRTWSHYSLGAFLTFSLLYWIAKPEESFSFLRNKWYLFAPFVGYFMLYPLYLFSEGFEWRFVENRLVFLILPIIGMSLFNSEYFSTKKNLLIKSYIFGLLTISVLLLIRAALIKLGFLNEPVIPENSIDAAYSHFFSRLLSFFQHPAYFSMELNLAIVLLFIFGKDLRFSLVFRLTLILFFLTLIYLLSSRAGVISTVLSLIWLLYSKLREIKLKKIYCVMILAGVAAAFVSLLFINPRISSSLKNIKTRIDKGESVQLINIEPRTRVWYSTLQLISEYPVLGVGVKELDNKLKDEYRRNNFYAEAFFTLNVHNQFLESQLTFGIPGSFLLIWMILVPFLRKKEYQNFILAVSFLTIILVHFMFESMLFRQWGILFFVLFSIFQLFLKPSGLILRDQTPDRNIT